MTEWFSGAVWPALLGLLPLITLVASAADGTEAWVRRYSHPIGAEDYVFQAATGPDGSVVVVGYTSTGVTGDDWLLVKYSAAGAPLWTNRFNGSANKNDRATVVAVNGGGNIVVSGFSFGTGTGEDFTTIAYSGAGLPLWTNRYNGPGFGSDQVRAITVDGGGNVLVSGESFNGSNSDYATIAYSGAGVPLWTNRYNAPGSSTDQARAIAADAAGNVFVTGYSFGTSAADDNATIAYSGAGVPLWTNRYNGTLSSADAFQAIAVSGTNVFVTGYSHDPVTGYDYATIAYSTAGEALWTNRYDGPGSSGDLANTIAVESGGNVYVAGDSIGSASGYDFAVIGYSSAGVPLWTNRYDGPGGQQDQARAIVMGGSGNILIAGLSFNGTSHDFATVGYSSAGVPLWTNRYDGPDGLEDQAQAIALGTNGNIVVAGHSIGNDTGRDFATVAYSGTGAPLWTNRCNEPGNGSDQARAVAVNSAARIFVTGWSLGNSTYNDYATVAFSDAGVPLWTNRYNGPGNSTDQAQAVAVDGTGHVFVTGDSYDALTGQDYTTIAYSDAGVPLWTNRYNGPANSTDQARAIAVGTSGSVFVCGNSYNGANSDFATLAYSGTGAPLWTNRYNGPVNGSDWANAVAVDASGRVIVSGYSPGVAVGDDFLTIAYSGAGVPLWTNQYNGPGNSDDRAEAAVVDADGTVFVTGQSFNGTSHDFMTIAYSAAGVPLWTNLYNGPDNGNDMARSIALDSSGNVFVCGESGLALFSDYAPLYATVAYSGAGVPLWTNRYSGPGGGRNLAYAIAASSNAEVYVSGYSVGSGSGDDFATIAYSAASVPLWTNRYNGPANGYDRVQTRSSLALAPDGLVVVGSSNGDKGGETPDFAVVKFFMPGRPVITSPPVAAVATCSTGSAAFTVAAIGEMPLAYQWRLNGVTIPGATGTTHTINPTTPDKSGAYTVVVTNAYGAVTSAVATLTLTNALPSVVTAFAFDLNPGRTLVIPPSALVSNNVSGPCVGPVAQLAFLSFSPTSANGGILISTAPGIPLWTNRYSSAGFFNDQATSIAVDNDGNVIVTGHAHGSGTFEDYVTLKYSGTGIPLWTNIHNGLANSGGRKGLVAVDEGGTVFTTVIHPGDFATVAYSTSGLPLWTNYYNGPANNEDLVKAMAVHPNGNVFVTGYSYGSSAYDFATVAYSATGVALWTNRYAGPGFFDDEANAIALDADGNVFVTGYSYGEDSSEDYATIAYTAAGVPLWTNRFNGLGDNENVSSNDRAQAIAVAPDGTVVVTGSARDANGIADLTSVAYSGLGQPLWTNRYHGPGAVDDRAVGVTVNADGVVVVTGESRGLGGFTDYDYATVAYALTGVPLWTNRYNGPASNTDSPAEVKTDKSGNFFVTGGSMLSGSGPAWDYATLCYTDTGFPLWTNRFNGTANNFDRATGLAVDSDGNAFVTGYATMAGTAQDYVTVAYSGSRIAYTPTNGFTGVDTFTFLVQDANSLTYTGTVAVAVGVVANTISTEVLPGGEVQLGFYGTPGQPYALERVFDLGSNVWSPQQTNIAAANGALAFTNLPAGSINFWRIRSLP